MAGRVEERREDLRTRLVDAAAAIVLAKGLSGVKARDLARSAGCSVGAIYNVFDDLTDVVLAVNGRTFRRLGQTITRALEERGDRGPADRLVTMSTAYLGFAAENTNAWRTLFDIEMSTEQDVPEWYLTELNQLFDLISRPLRQLRPDLSQDEAAVLTRALFSSIHGIVLLGLEKRISGVPRNEIEPMIALVLNNFAGVRQDP